MTSFWKMPMNFIRNPKSKIRHYNIGKIIKIFSKTFRVTAAVWKKKGKKLSSFVLMGYLEYLLHL